ncbi:hypothetical protein XarbCFBP7409_08660 [Xanthomonas arboricola pv. guizotiae]|uniref:Uncharacterized protein n=1 Tax=Xanthomonas arboricola pv. guizotiae TaxID=487867 RepID=A0A2S7A3J6_9XANT|nr:hypothetical protein XarbCFBP7409_08660 [Xanthomonas arboricola pv. guizotiae]
MRDAGSGFGIRDSGFGIRDSGFGIRDSGFGTRDSGLGIRESGIGNRESGRLRRRRNRCNRPSCCCVFTQISMAPSVWLARCLLLGRHRYRTEAASGAA